MGGATGFTNATRSGGTNGNITTLANLTVGDGNGVVATVTTAETFSMSGTLEAYVDGAVQNSFTATAGTITMTGTAKKIEPNPAEAITLYNVVIATGATITHTQGTVTLKGNFTTVGTGSFVGTGGSVTLDGTTTLTNAGTLTIGTWTISGSGSVTLGSNIVMAGANTLTLNGASAVLNTSSYQIDMSGASTPQVTLTAGTFKTAKAGGVVASFANYSADEISVAAGINLEFTGAATTLGLTFGASCLGAGTNLLSINSIGDLTFSGAAAVTGATARGATPAATTIAGSITVGSTASVDFSNAAEVGIDILLTGTSKSIVNNGTLKLPDLNVSTGTYTTASSFELAGTTADLSIIVGATGSLVASAGTITMSGATGGITVTAGGVLTFYNITMSGAVLTDGATADFNIAGNLNVTGGFTATAATITFTGASKTITNSGTLVFWKVLVNGTITTASSFSVSGTAAGSLTTGASGSLIASAGTITMSGASAGGIVNGNVLKFWNFATAAAALTAVNTSFTIQQDFTTGAGLFTATGGTITMTSTTGVITVGAGALTVFNLTVDGSSSAIVTITTTDIITVEGTLSVTSGGKIITSTALAITDGVAGTFTLASGATWETNLAGGFAASTSINTFTGNTNANYILGALATDAGFDVSGGAITACNNLTINSTATLADLSGHITVHGTLAVGAGATYTEATLTRTITMDGTSGSITIGAGGAMSIGKLVIATGASVTTAASFTILNATTTAFDIQGTGSFSATAGTITMNGATNGITVAAAGALTLYNLTLGALSTGFTTASSFTINGTLNVNALALFTASTPSTVTLAGTTQVIALGAANNRLIFYNLTVSGSYTQTGNQIFQITKNLNVTGSFIPGTGTVAFTGAVAQTISNTGTLTFNNLTSSGASTVVSTNSDFTIEGTLTTGADATTGAFIASLPSTITFASAAIITPAGDASTVFKNVNIADGATVTSGAAFDITIKGNLTVLGSGSMDMTAFTNAVVFDSTCTKTISNAVGTLIFDDLIIANTTGNNVQTSTNLSIGTDLTIGANATFVASAGTVTFLAGTSNITNNSTSPAALTFYSLAAATGCTIDLANDDEFYIKGDLTFTGTGDFQSGGSSKVTFNGSSPQNLTIGTGTPTFEFITLNNSTGLTLNGDFVQDAFTINQTLRLQSGDIDLNGNNVITLADDGTNTSKLSETAGNTVKNSGPASSTGKIVKEYDPATNTLTNENIGGLGVRLKSTVDPIIVTVSRYHTAVTPGGSSSINRYFTITHTGVTDLDAQATFLYDESELNGNTEADLELFASGDGTTWVGRTATQDTDVNSFRITGINSFSSTSSTKYWTAASSPRVTLAELTKGVYTDPLTAGAQNKAILGFSLTANGTANFSAVTLSFTSTAASKLQNLELWQSDDNDYSTTSDNTLITTFASPTTTSASVAFGSTVTLSAGVAKNYFVVGDVVATVNAGTASVTPSIIFSNITVANSVMNTDTVTGATYTFQPGLYITDNRVGLAATPLIANAANQAIVGFKMNTNPTNNASFNGFDIVFDKDPTTLFSGALKVYKSTDATWSTTADNFYVAEMNVDTMTSSAAYTAHFVLPTQTVIAGSTVNIFLIAEEIKANATRDLGEFTPTINQSSISGVSAGPIFEDSIYTGPSYSFGTLEVVPSISSTYVPSSLYIGQSHTNQPVFGFILTPNGTCRFNGLTVDFTLASGLATGDLSNFKLWADANNNGMPDAGEFVAIGTWASSQSVFSSFGSVQSFSSATRYLVTADIASTADVDGTIYGKIASEKSITMASPCFVRNGSYTGNTKTVKASGTATKLAIIDVSTTPVVTGGAVTVTVQMQDANSYPVNASSGNGGFSISNSANITTVGGTTTGTIANGSDFIAVSNVTVATAAGTTAAALLADHATLTDGVSTAFTILPASAGSQMNTISATVSNDSTINIASWSNGSGDGRIIVIKEGSAPTAPTDGIAYTATTDMSTIGNVGVQQTAAGSVVVYSGTGASSSTNITGLVPGTTYYIQGYEYTGSSSLTNYISSIATGNPVSLTMSGTTGADPGDAITTARPISNNTDVYGTISSSTDTDWYIIHVPSTEPNLMITLQDLPANYSLELRSTSDRLIRVADNLSTTGETIIINNVTQGKYLLKIFGVSSAYSTTAYKVRVNTSALEYMSQP
jgi:hypothetical protein